MPADLGDVVAAVNRNTELVAANLADLREAVTEASGAQNVRLKFTGVLRLLELGAYDGAHHKDWCLDQIARTVLGEGYTEWVRAHPEWAHVVENAIAP